MGINYIGRTHDEEIIGLIRSILSDATFTVETFNEAVLVKLMQLRGTPIAYDKNLRDINADYEQWKQNQ